MDRVIDDWLRADLIHLCEEDDIEARELAVAIREPWVDESEAHDAATRDVVRMYPRLTLDQAHHILTIGAVLGAWCRAIAAELHDPPTVEI